jgi:hypothetical protein
VTLSFGLVVKPEGHVDWLALGLSSEAGGMKGVDVAMLWLPTTSAADDQVGNGKVEREGKARWGYCIPRLPCTGLMSSW